MKGKKKAQELRRLGNILGGRETERPERTEKSAVRKKNDDGSTGLGKGCGRRRRGTEN